MIVFNNVALESIAPVLVEDIRVSPIQLTPTARELPIKWGAEFVRMTGGKRSVDITFGLPEDKPEVRSAYLMQIVKWARSETPRQLCLPSYEGLYLDAICTGLPEPSMRQWWESKLRMTFTTYDNPYFTSVAWKEIACGTAFAVVGSAPPLMQITRSLAVAVTNQSYTDGTDTMTFSDIPAGNLVVDLNKQTAAVGTTSILQYYAFGSTFIRPHTGTMTITGTGTVRWCERWE